MFKALFKWLSGKSSAEAPAQNTCSCGCSAGHGTGERVASIEDLERFVEYVVRQLVDDPDAVGVKTEVAENGVKVIRISCRKEDAGKIIGKKGKTIIALRALVGSAAGRLQERISVEVVD